MEEGEGVCVEQEAQAITNSPDRIRFIYDIDRRFNKSIFVQKYKFI